MNKKKIISGFLLHLNYCYFVLKLWTWKPYLYWLDISGDDDLLDSDITDYEDAEDNNNEVEVLSDDDDDDVKTVVGIKRTFKEELEEESIEVVEVVTAPVQYNNSKYFKKRKVCQRTEIIGEFSLQQKTDLTYSWKIL